MNITWLGQSGFILKHNNLTVVLDPYLSTVVEDIKGYNRLIAPVMAPEELQADILFCSHNHFDHFDPVTVAAIIKNYPSCKIYGPGSVPERANEVEISIPDFQVLEVGDKFTGGNFEFTALPAKHSDPKALGLFIKVNGLKIYFSGDTLYYPGLAGEIRDYIGKKLDLAFLCINGKGNNMNDDEAAVLAKELNTASVIPTHYGMFAENTVSPDDFIQKCNEFGVSTLLLDPGKPYQTMFER